MISYLTGKAHHKTGDSVTLLVGGVGYLVFVPPSQLAKIVIGEEIELHIHTHVREELIDLYGFVNIGDLTIFKHLINVSGIGPKTALGILDHGAEAVKQAIVKADEGFFTLVPRLCKKNAQKIIIELKSKLGSTVNLDLSGDDQATSEIIQALLSMGYSKAEAIEVVRKMPPEISTIKEQVRFALRQMDKPG